MYPPSTRQHPEYPRQEDPQSIEQPSSLRLIRELCEELNAAGLLYCHWKSNAALDRCMGGEGDLDLLVSRAHAQAFSMILLGLGFRLVQDDSDPEVPGIVHYYGHDRESDRLVHVHAHYCLTVGHDATKNCHLPIERAYLESAKKNELIPVATPAFEMVVFVIRMMLKHSTWDTILARQGRLSGSERRELEYLRARASQAQLHSIVAEHLPWISADLFDACLGALDRGVPVWVRARTGYRLQRSLRAHCRRPLVTDTWFKLWRRAVGAFRRRLSGNVPSKRMASGGVMVAVVGGDGSGKTTTVDAVHGWLVHEFRTIKVHMGRPRWSVVTVIVRAMLRVGRTLISLPFPRPRKRLAQSSAPPPPGHSMLIRGVCAARDRYLAYTRARRFVASGGLVICDRFPMPQISLMDGPRYERVRNSLPSSLLVRSLASLEQRYYQSIALPEVVIVLRVDPEIAVARRAEADAETVRVRCAEVWEAEWQETRIHVVDSSQPKAQVLSEVKALIWSQL
jgi:thymidylate kinase